MAKPRRASVSLAVIGDELASETLALRDSAVQPSGCLFLAGLCIRRPISQNAEWQSHVGQASRLPL